VVGHADVLLGFLQEQDAREHWQRWNDKALPKYIGYFEYAGDVDRSALDRGDTRFWTMRRTTPYDDHYPVPVRVVNVSELAGFSSDDLKAAFADHNFARRKNAEHTATGLAKAMLEDLYKLHVNAIMVAHRTKKDDQSIAQFLIMLPRIKLEGDPANPQEMPDFEGGVTLLAYLLHKGYVTRKDRFPGGAISVQKDLTRAFDQTELEFAESAHYQNKVRAALGEPLLTEETYGQNKGTRLI